jgi:hypothetical protein
MTTDKILDKLAKLKAARDGEAAIGNQAAADAFAGMINTLLLRHELSDADIPLPADQDPIVEQMIDPARHGFKFSKTRVAWQEQLASVVAYAHLCRILVHSGSNYVTFVGTRSHTAVAEYAFVVLVRAADAMSRRARDEYWKAHRDEPDFESGNFRAAWLRGFIGRIAERFREIREHEVRAAPSSSTALVRLNQQLVRANDYIKNLKTTKAAPVRQRSGCYEGQLEGRRAADRMDIGKRGVHQGADRRELS